jgi:hypothetical protein
MGSFWPSRTQELLLRTALGRPDARIAAWAELVPGTALPELAPGTLAVLPLVYAAVRHERPEDPSLPRLKGTYRSAWAKNQLLAERLGEAVDAFAAAGVEQLLIGGLASAQRYYPELGLRPTPSLEFLIDPGARTIATRALGRLGWSTPSATGADDREPITFANASGQLCLLRTTLTRELELDLARLAPAAIELQIVRCTVPTLPPEYELLGLCAAGARIKPVRSVQWLVDLAQILQTTAATLSWALVVELAADQGQTPALRRSLAYLEDVLELPVPPAGRSALRDARASGRERAAYACAATSIPGAGSFPQAIAEHLIATRNRSFAAALAGFPGFLGRRWGTRLRRLPPPGPRRAYGLLRPPRDGRA